MESDEEISEDLVELRIDESKLSAENNETGNNQRRQWRNSHEKRTVLGVRDNSSMQEQNLQKRDNRKVTCRLKNVENIYLAADVSREDGQSDLVDKYCDGITSDEKPETITASTVIHTNDDTDNSSTCSNSGVHKLLNKCCEYSYITDSRSKTDALTEKEKTKLENKEIKDTLKVPRMPMRTDIMKDQVKDNDYMLSNVKSCNKDSSESMTTKTEMTSSLYSVHRNVDFSSMPCVNTTTYAKNHVTNHTSNKYREVESELLGLETARTKLKERELQIANQVNVFINLFIEAVEKHRNILLSQINDIVKSKEEKLKNKENELKSSMSEKRTNLENQGDQIKRRGIKSADVNVNVTVSRSKFTEEEVCESLQFVPEIPASVIGGFQMFGTVTGQRVDPDKSYLRAPTQTVVVGKRSTVKLCVRDTDGLSYPCPVKVKALLKNKRRESNYRPVRVHQKPDGVYNLCISPIHQGTHYLYVSVNDVPVKGSPMTIYIEEEDKSDYYRSPVMYSYCDSDGRENRIKNTSDNSHLVRFVTV